MAITDLWGNSLNGVTTDVLGYRGEFTEFPHNLYSYISSSTRDDDQKDVSLIYRWLLGAQSYWEAQYNTTLGLFSLLSPEDCPEKYLDYLKYTVGIHKGLNYIWGTMTENEKRIFIKNHTDAIKFRFSDSGIKLILEKLTKEFVYLRDFFYYRWILSGDAANEAETQIGRDDDGYDLWSIGDDNYSTGQKPDDITSATTSLYTFKLTTMVNDFPYDDIPPYVYTRCFVTEKSQKGYIYESGGDYYVDYVNYYFEQDSDLLSSDVNQFRISFESDPYISDILITDRDGTLNRDMIEAVVRYNRPASERFYIRYYQWIDQFDYDDFWALELLGGFSAGTLVHDSTNKKMTLTGDAVFPGAISLVNVTGMDNWTDYEFTAKIKITHRGTQMGMTVMYQDDPSFFTYGYFFEITQNSSPTTDSHSWTLNRYNGGPPVLISSGTYTGSLDLDVDYVWRINCWVSARGAGDYQKIQIYKDEELIYDGGENKAFSPPEGKVGIYLMANNDEIEISEVSVRPIPNDNYDNY
jgi:hypothetical protein